MKYKPMSVFVLMFMAVIISSCKKGKDVIGPENVEVGKAFFTVLPLEPEEFYLFVNLGHMNPPGHTFPSAHGGFYLTDYMNKRPVYSPADMRITRFKVAEHVGKGYSDYTIEMAVNDGQFKVMLGHLSSIHPALLAQAPPLEDGECESYSSGLDSFRTCMQWVDIPVSAGDTLGEAGGNPGQFGLDFGVYNRAIDHDWQCKKLLEYDYPWAVSPMDYFTDEINAILIPITGDGLGGRTVIRTTSPIGGRVNFNSPGTAQGIWFRTGAPLFPENQHIALVYHNADPDVPIISVGTSQTGLPSGEYSFTPTDTGLANRHFVDVVSNGQVYTYRIHYPTPTWFFEYILLVQMISETEIKIEKQEITAGPPWEFTDNAVEYER
ncbi:hypothetical protein KAR48_14415 [bacterium]|nr:hypothetical protein [bacterium]